MYRRNGTGPTGQGRGIGKGLGPCGQNNKKSQDQGFQGGRRGIGRGKKRLWSRSRPECGLGERTEGSNDR